jgi:hypothetical protein
LNTLTGAVNSTLSNVPGGPLAATFIDNNIALTNYELDGLAAELADSGGSPLTASLDATIAQEALSFSQLNAMYDLQVVASVTGSEGGSDNGSTA